jgi:hypothetical protein
MLKNNEKIIDDFKKFKNNYSNEQFLKIFINHYLKIKNREKFDFFSKFEMTTKIKTKYESNIHFILFKSFSIIELNFDMIEFYFSKIKKINSRYEINPDFYLLKKYINRFQYIFKNLRKIRKIKCNNYFDSYYNDLKECMISFFDKINSFTFDEFKEWLFLFDFQSTSKFLVLTSNINSKNDKYLEYKFFSQILNEYIKSFDEQIDFEMVLSKDAFLVDLKKKKDLFFFVIKDEEKFINNLISKDLNIIINLNKLIL